MAEFLVTEVNSNGVCDVRDVGGEIVAENVSAASLRDTARLFVWAAEALEKLGEVDSNGE